MPMTDAEKALAYDKLVAAFAEALRAQGWGTPSYRSYDDLKAELTDAELNLDACRSVLDATKRDLAACEAKLPPEPPPPSRKWRTEKIATKRSDWKSTLISIPGATITDSHLPGTDTPALRYWVPGPDDYGGDSRCEVQVQPAGVEGEWWAYEWGLWVPERTVVPTFYGADGSTTIAQHHGNDRATYTGGVGMQKDGTLLAKISGGSQRGKNDYEYEERMPFGAVERDRLHTIRLEILWHRSEGHYLAYFDGELGAERHDVPTWPIGEADGDPTDNIMWRLGWYPQGGRVAGPMEMWTTPCEFEVEV